MRNNKKKNSKSNFIVLFIVLVLAIAVGYAAFNDNLSITGTANAKGAFDVVFSKANLLGTSEGIDTVNSTATIDPSDSDTVTISAVDLNNVSSHADYTITIQNNSHTRAKINSLTVNGLDTTIFNVSGYETAYNTILAANDGQEGGEDEVTFTLVVALKNGAEIKEENVEASFTLSMEYVEATNSDTRTSSVSSNSVADFFASASSVTTGGTVTLSDNITFDTTEYPANSYTQVVYPDNTTLDLNGNTITSANGSVLISGNGLTIQNGTLNGLADSNGRTYTTVWNYTGKSSNITLSNVTATGGLNFYNTENVVLNSCNVTSGSNTYYALYGNEYGNTATTITINGGTYTAGSSAKALIGYNGQGNPTDGFKIYGGTFTTNGKKFCLTSGTHIPPVIYGGTFDCDVSSYCATGYTCIDNGNGTYTVQAQ